MEGTFSRLFRTGLSAVEIGRKIVRAMEDSKTVDVKGKPVVANFYRVALSSRDLDRFASIVDTLRRELEDAVREAAADERCSFLGPVEVLLEADPKLPPGSLRVAAHLREAEGGVPPGSLLLPDGRRVRLGPGIAMLGRAEDADVRITDPKVSRRHAEISLRRDRYLLRDLGSTNGTFLNGRRIDQSALVDGDVIRLGDSEILFQES
ncbi:MAG: hypothetical protein KatS3mg008_1382 [Acidimicrobiales bacterium]|nr:MAG: hypothetical protein KatS3mg008_1382 [Acidimicrobiales bacterium]